MEVRARGVSPKARQRLTAADLAWADLVLVMEKEHRARMCRQFQDAMEEVEIVVLDIPDDYGYMDPELEEMLREHVEALLG